MKNATRPGPVAAAMSALLFGVTAVLSGGCPSSGSQRGAALPTVVLTQSGQKRVAQPAPAMPGKNVPAIKVNTVGYPRGWPKLAIFNVPAEGARVVDLTSGKVEMTISAQQVEERGIDPASQDPVWQVDLSALDRPGRFQLMVGTASSDPFAVGDDLYRPALAAGLKSFYFQRCRTPLRPPHARWQGQSYERARACHDHGEVGWDLGAHPRKEPGRRFPLVSGWHDAGNFDMYVGSTAVTAQTLLLAYQWGPKLFPDGQSNIPESGNGQSDLLDETRQGLLWILALQEPEGGVRHGEAAVGWSPEGAAENDRSERWVGQVSSSATAKAVAALAPAAALYAGGDRDFAERCRRGAKAGWRWLQKHPDHVRAARVAGGAQPLWDDEPGFSDVGARFAAAVAVWLLERDGAALEVARGMLKVVETSDPEKIVLGTWANISRMGLWGLASDERTPAEVRAEAQRRLMAAADLVRAGTKKDGYRCASSVDDYFWASNSNLMEKVHILAMAARLAGAGHRAALIEAARDQWHWILGRNPNGFSMVTGVGKGPARIYHMEWGAREPPPPGFLIGGPNAQNAGWLAPGAPAKALLWDNPGTLRSGLPPHSLWHWRQSDLWDGGFVAEGEWTEGWWAVVEPDILYSANFVLAGAALL